MNPLNFKTIDLKQGRQRYDICQIKFDGWFCYLKTKRDDIVIYSKTQRELKTYPRPEEIPPGLTFMGEYLFGTNWVERRPHLKGRIVVYDVLQPLPYSQRYRQVKEFVRVSTGTIPVLLVQNFHTTQANEVWLKAVVAGGHEGLVFRNWKDDSFDLGRCKAKYEEVYYVVGVTEGVGKHAGRLGALVIETLDGTREGRVGGGFTDEQREAIWESPDDYIGRFVEVEGKALFNSGLLRHPNFKAWKPEGWEPRMRS